MSNANFPSVSPLASFAAVSGINPASLKILLGIFLASLLVLAYIWSVNHGYKVIETNGDFWGYLKLILWGAGLLICVITFFIY
ncbi:hypothetical protein BKK47_07295 [Rodentibacter mrazii]|uniref:Uncharacterized protein n=1 Tax=Rodentibacter mrazii TaxID=1908257 RepID=A0A1V3IFG6_9PAST|nr:DUF3262 family protein [Rodentibacter mrazii]OOF39168.1 hypothetical protein BKK47_07295 [Rodentibacter mrazii]